MKISARVKSSRGVAIVTGLLALSSCGQSQAEKICTATMREGLVNPETGEFHDFSSLSQTAFRDQYADKLAGSFDGTTASTVKEEAKSEFDRKMSQFKNPSFYSVRVRSDGELGNKITKKMMCTLVSDGCLCV